MGITETTDRHGSLRQRLALDANPRISVTFVYASCNTTALRPRKWIDVPSPLTTGFLTRIQALKAIFEEVYPKSFDDWVQGFELDGAPERELLIWEWMALTYRTFAEDRTRSMEAKQEALGVILQCSAGTPEEHLLKAGRKALHKVEILALVDSYRAAAKAFGAINQSRKTK